jgi:hypothetical protein
MGNKLTHRDTDRRRTKPKKKWPKLKLFASLALATVVGYALCTPRGGPDCQSRPAIVEKELKAIPPADIKLDFEQSKKPTHDFKEMDAIITSCFSKESTGLDLAQKMGLKREVPDILKKAKAKLEAEGYAITSGADKPEEIFEKLFQFYIKNNRWVLIRTGEGKAEPGAYWFSVPLKQTGHLSFSYFDGKISEKDVPVYCSTEDPGKLALPGGLITKHGILILTGNVDDPSYSHDKIVHDLALHEGIHYFITKKENKREVDEYDFDMRFDENIADEELKAYLLQMIYGNYPRIAMNSLIRTDIRVYHYARKTVKNSFIGIMKRDPDRWERYLQGEIMTPEEIRKYAHATLDRYWPLD